MNRRQSVSSSRQGYAVEARLAGYLAAASASVLISSKANAGIVANTAVQPFGINGDVNIDFNHDGQTDFQIDHDRVNVNGSDLDYLQIDKNDVNGATNPLAFDSFPGGKASTFPPGLTTPNNQDDAGYLITGPIGSYPAALTAGTPIGPLSTFDYQEGNNFNSSNKWIRANRLIDEDATQIDQALGGRAPSGVYVPTNGPNFLGLNGDVRYLGVKMKLNGSAQANYGWIGVRIDNEADATGAVVGYGYETTGLPILAGQVPEPGSMLMAAFGSLALIGAGLRRRLRMAVK
jgi:hypothetical protein